MRAMKVADETWKAPGDESSYWLDGALKFADEFEGWAGFGTVDDEDRMGYPEKQ